VELWSSDGTAAGTARFADLLPGPNSSAPGLLAAAAGTSLLADVAPGPLSSSPLSFIASGANVYFAANDNATGFELWAVRRSTVAGALGFYTVAPCRPRSPSTSTRRGRAPTAPSSRSANGRSRLSPSSPAAAVRWT